MWDVWISGYLVMNRDAETVILIPFFIFFLFFLLFYKNYSSLTTDHETDLGNGEAEEQQEFQSERLGHLAAFQLAMIEFAMGCKYSCYVKVEQASDAGCRSSLA